MRRVAAGTALAAADDGLSHRAGGRDLPPGCADAESFRRFVTEARGVRPGNVIHVRDATGARMEGVFGDETDHRGQLFDWVRPGKSRVYVYYAGHGVPAGDDGGTYLVPAVSVTVVLEACFSGVSQAGPVVPRASEVYVRPRAAANPPNLTVIGAGAADQTASWEPDGRHSLFTSHFLMAMAGAADAPPYGNGAGTVAWEELERYLQDTLTYLARRHYGRDQTAAVVVGSGG